MDELTFKICQAIVGIRTFPVNFPDFLFKFWRVSAIQPIFEAVWPQQQECNDGYFSRNTVKYRLTYGFALRRFVGHNSDINF